MQFGIESGKGLVVVIELLKLGLGLGVKHEYLLHAIVAEPVHAHVDDRGDSQLDECLDNIKHTEALS